MHQLHFILFMDPWTLTANEYVRIFPLIAVGIKYNFLSLYFCEFSGSVSTLTSLKHIKMCTLKETRD